MQAVVISSIACVEQPYGRRGITTAVPIRTGRIQRKKRNRAPFLISLSSVLIAICRIANQLS